MPIWNIHHPEGTFTSLADKQALARAITQIYTSAPALLPPFYVNVNYIPIAPTSMFVGGELRPYDRTHIPNDDETNSNDQAPGSTKPFIRFVVDHIAIRLADKDSEYQRVCDKIDRAVTEHMTSKGYDWEYHVSETERRLWRINGISPPAWKSDGEKVWREKNVPVPLD